VELIIIAWCLALFTYYAWKLRGSRPRDPNFRIVIVGVMVAIILMFYTLDWLGLVLTIAQIRC